MRLSRLLVVGASGFLGRRLVQTAHAQGLEVLGTRSRSATEGALPFDLLRDRILEVVPRSFFAEGEVVAVITTVSGRMDAIARDPELSHTIDVVNTIRLIEDLLEIGATPVFISTSFVFDGKRGGYSEDESRNPISHYGRNKAEVETWLADHAPGVFIPRLDKLVGKDADENHLFSEWRLAAGEKRPIVCIKDQVFSPTLVDDVTHAILLGLIIGLRGVYHVANPEPWPRDALARLFLELGRLDAPIIMRTQEELGFLDARPLRSFLDICRFAKATGFSFTPMPKVITAYLEQAKVRRTK